MVGARVVKTSLAVLLSILIARSLDLNTPQFAGIIAVLAVQPSIYRSIRYGCLFFGESALNQMEGKRIHPNWLESIMQKRRHQLWQGQSASTEFAVKVRQVPVTCRIIKFDRGQNIKTDSPWRRKSVFLLIKRIFFQKIRAVILEKKKDMTRDVVNACGHS